jgi:hypothetical protein
VSECQKANNTKRKSSTTAKEAYLRTGAAETCCVTKCCRKKNIGKPYEGKPHVRFDKEGLENLNPPAFHFTTHYIG